MSVKKKVVFTFDERSYEAGAPEPPANSSFAAPAGSAPDRSVYRANFLWGKPHGSIEEAGYEFANGQTEEYRKEWWGILLERVKAQNAEVQRPRL